MIAIHANAFAFFKPWVAKLPPALKDITINNLCFDSRQVTPGDAFVVMPSVAGQQGDYIKSAQDKGATLFICGEDASAMCPQPCLLIPDLQQVMGALLQQTLGNACHQMALIGITGTNGKSSISFYLAQLLNELNMPCAVMGTLGYGDMAALTVTGMTTLPLEPLHLALRELSERYQAIAMEVSSHGLEQGRLAGVSFNGAIFSNLSRDHLDYHGDMAAYGAAKAKLFQWPNLEFAIINMDDDFAADLAKSTRCEQVIYYGRGAAAHLKFSFEKIHGQGMTLLFSWQGCSQVIELPLYGEFNAYNVAAALACALQMGFDFTAAVKALRVLQGVPGRMQQIPARPGEPLVLIDYAHTPDALQQALQAVRQHCTGKIHLVVGCGGDRDVGKRPLMGEIALHYADIVFYTSDNPRTESPQAICAQMTAHLPTGSFHIELDRKKAIEAAINMAGPTDLVVIAGKGHEDYQEIKGHRHYFSDETVATAALKLGASR